jgi:protein-S-isoprenylcysteine O-methyltransferase Ste14
MWLDILRYYLALMVLFGVPGGLLLWLLIHPFVKFWQRLGLIRTYISVGVPVFLLMGAIVWFRDTLLAIDYGTNYPLMALAIPPCALAVVLYRAHHKYLTPAIQIGLPEVTGQKQGLLLSQGIYSRIRHPRYVETVLWILGYALFTNFLALYLIFLFLLPMIHIIVLFEEKELQERFGRAYAEYCARVPRYVPKNLFGRAQGRATRFL